MSLAPDRTTLFVSLRSSGQLASFRIAADTGQLTLVSIAEGGADPAYLLPDRTGRYLLSAYYEADQVAVHAIGADGELSSKAVQTIATADKAHGLAIDASNRVVFVPHTGSNRIYQFFFDASRGRLTPSDPPFLATRPEDHPRHIALHPSDRWAYVNNEAGDSLSVYAVNLDRATLDRLQTVSTIPDDFEGTRNATARCEMTPDGRFVYVANRGHDSLAGFAIDQSTGRLTALGPTATEKTPRSFSIDPQGRFLYVAGEASGRIAAYRIMEDGQLDRLGVYDAGPIAWCVLAADVPRRDRGERE